MASTVRVAAVQAEPVWLDAVATTTKTLRLIEEAAAGGAELVAFPETWIPGYPVHIFTYPVPLQMEFAARYHANSVEVGGPEIERIRDAARLSGITVVLGLSERDHGSLYMSQLIIGPDGNTLLHRRKLKPTHVERAVFGDGDGSGLQVVELPFGRLGALNCFEHIQSLVKFAMYAQHEQIHVAGWPCFGILGQVPTLSPEACMSASQTYALEGSSFVIVSTQIMSDEGAMAFPLDGARCPVYTGGGGYARVYGPDSALLTERLDPSEEGLVYCDLDLAAVNMAKNFVDPIGHYARADVFTLTVDRTPRVPALLTTASSPRDPGDSTKSAADTATDSAEELGPHPS